MSLLLVRCRSEKLDLRRLPEWERLASNKTPLLWERDGMIRLIPWGVLTNLYKVYNDYLSFQKRRGSGEEIPSHTYTVSWEDAVASPEKPYRVLQAPEENT